MARDVSETLNVYDHTVNHLKAVAISRFSWQNLPDEIDEFFMEKIIVENGCGIFTFDEVVEEYLALRLGGNYGFNVYNIPFYRECFAANGCYYTKSAKDSIVIFNNVLRQSDMGVIYAAAERIANMQRTMDVNIGVQKTPFAVVADEDTALTVNNMYLQIIDNKLEVNIIKKKKESKLKELLESIKVLNFNAPFIADKVREEKEAEWNRALCLLGIPVIQRNKKERYINSELSGELAEAKAFLLSAMKPRIKACKQINKMFGLNVSVELDPEIEKYISGGIYGNDTATNNLPTT